MKTKKMTYVSLFGFLIIVLWFSVYQAVAIVEDSDLIVTNNNDSGTGSLRQAIMDANDIEGKNTIHFHIEADGVQRIEILSPLPAITDTVLIDATTQNGANCEDLNQSPMIELDGSLAGEGTSGLHLLGSDIVVRGLIINRFDKHGIFVNSVDGHNRFECNFIGTDAIGREILSNGRSGIYIYDSPDNTIGSIEDGMGNLISGNGWDGVAILGYAASYNKVIGNLIGTDVTGTSALGNKNVGVYIDSASYNYIGGADPFSRNIISGNLWEGIYIYKPMATHNIITGNYIGTDVTGTIAVGNNDSGIVISQAAYNLIGGVTPNSHNVISANGLQGIYIFAPTARENTVIGNYIGLDATGTVPLGNLGSGVYLDLTISNTIGGDELNHHNLISSNGEYGIYIYGNGLVEDQVYANTFGNSLENNVELRNGLSDIHQDLQDLSRES